MPVSSSGPAATRSAFAATDVALLVTLASMWGFSFMFIKVAVHEVSPLWVVASRTSIGGLVLLAVLAIRGTRLPSSPRVWAHLIVLAVPGNIIPWTAVAWAEQSVPSGLAAVLNALVPVTTLALAVLIGLERLTGLKIAGLFIALVGTGVIVSGEVAIPGRPLPVLVVVSATLFYAIGAVYAKRYVSHRERPLAIAAGQVTLAGLLSVPAAAIVGPNPAWSELGLSAIGSLAALGVFGTGLAFLVFYTLIARVGATHATMVTYLIPPIGLVAGWLILGERFGSHIFLGAAVIVAGVWLAQRERRAEDPAVPHEGVGVPGV